MVLGILTCATVGGLWTGIGILYNLVSEKSCLIVGFHLIAKIIGFFFSWTVLVKWTEIGTGFFIYNAEVLGILFLGALSGGLYPFFMSRAMCQGGSGITWALGQAAMLVPLIVSVLVWDESVTVLKLLGITAILNMIFSLGIRNSINSNDRRWYLYMGLTFLFIGISQVLFSVPSHVPYWDDSANIRVATVSTAALIVYVTLSFSVKPRFTREVMLLGIIHALLAPMSHQLTFISMDILEAN